LRELGDHLTRGPLLEGNRIEPLINGDDAYPAMLKAIDEAKATIALSTYQFDRDSTGASFTHALARAVGRGVNVKVLIDFLGANLHWPTVEQDLKRLAVPFRMFSPISGFHSLLRSNYRNHRKILVVDGHIGFTGGINIIQSHLLSSACPTPLQDVHFRIEGPLVTSMSRVFADDWLLASGELLREEEWLPPLEGVGLLPARGVASGPYQAASAFRELVLSAISIAQSSLWIVTPYFIPDRQIIDALTPLPSRKVEVNIVIPIRNFKVVEFVSQSIASELASCGCNIYLNPPPFDHTKLMLLDQSWVLFGSSNWHARSFRYNREFDVECYSCEFSRRLEQLVRAKLATATTQMVFSPPSRIKRRFCQFIGAYM
jgi:cardiolipin synthase